MGERFRHVAAVVLMVVFIFFLLLLLVFVGTRTTAVVGVFFFSLLFEKAFISFLLHFFLLLLMLLIGFMFAVLFHHASRGTWVTVLTKIAAVILCSLSIQKDSLHKKPTNRRNSLPGQRVVCRMTEDRNCLFLFFYNVIVLICFCIIDVLNFCCLARLLF